MRSEIFVDTGAGRWIFRIPKHLAFRGWAFAMHVIHTVGVEEGFQVMVHVWTVAGIAKIFSRV